MLETLPCGTQAFAHLKAQAVALLGAIDGDDGDAVGAGIEENGGVCDVSSGHGDSVCWLLGARRDARIGNLETFPSLRAAQRRSNPATQPGLVPGLDCFATLAMAAKSESALLDRVRGAVELFAEIRMRDRDQAARAFGERLALEFGGAEFGDDDVDVTARGGDRAGQAGDDLAERAALGGCRQRDDRAATARTRTGTDEVDLAAGAAQIRAAALLGVDLAGEIDFERRVDRHQLVEQIGRAHV